FNSFGCPATSTQVITVHPNPTLTVVPNQTFVCSGMQTTLTGAGAQTYSWSTGSTASITVVSPNQTTTYTVTGYNTNGCPGTATQMVTFSPNPTISAVAGQTNICSGMGTNLAATGAQTYLWSTGSTNSLIVVSPN